jgi:alkylated DNA nucleotide flippase Atl1
MSLKDMQEAYRLSNEALHKALYSYMPTQQHSYEELLAYHLAHDDTQEHFALSNKDYDEFISSIEGKQTTLAQRISIELAKGKTYREVAKTLGCSKSRVAQVCQEVRQQQNVLPWPEVCKYAREHGVTSAAALYKCTRGAIYYHLENNRCEAT